MLSLGLAGGLDPVHESRLDSPENFTYDGAAVLVEDGVVVAAIEEARVDRIRRSNKFPVAAIRFCLDQHGVRPEDLDRIAYYAPEAAANFLLSRIYLAMPEIEWRLDARTLLAATLGRELGAQIDPAKLRFFDHKLTHAAGAMAQSGFDEALVLVLDNSGGLFRSWRNDAGVVELAEIVAIPPPKSTTRLCQTLLPYLGLGPLDDQKAVALAPYGDPAVFRPLFQSFYELLPDGDYNLRLERVMQLVGRIEPQGKNGPGQQHKDLAAALQEAQEEIVLHLLRYHREATGLTHLCMAGGIVENSRTNGKVLYSGLFDEIFVHPAATDAGCALGCALMASEDAGRPAPRQRLFQVDWGTEAGDEGRIAAELASWAGYLTYERVPKVALQTAALLAQGQLVAWVQGRSEFSPRSLGNRSILADPRSAGVPARVDAALHRPPGSVAVAPSILEAEAGHYFDLPPGAPSFPYMAFGVKARDERRADLAAALHTDGTAWLQTVSRELNPRLFEVLTAFKAETGVPALFNTSFTSDSGPVVDSVEDAVAAFLTTEIDVLVLGDFIARRTAPNPEARRARRISLPPYVRLQQVRGFVTPERMAARCEIRTSYDANLSIPISSGLYSLLMALSGEEPLGDLLRNLHLDTAGEEALLQEIDELWARRLVQLRGGNGVA
ncbi:MAG TPA: carbamoyltransferase C-terminal domain-containing protein [Thermoanaerobaculia bacterium]|nr:carbamoyltransferase C-terminal domain-containing protein [Thermoanaerobaculia bacterium]